MDHLEAALGRPVEYLSVESIDGQLAALKSGYLHVTGLNTGSVPRAVNICGFVPVCPIADGEGDFGYQMQIIVPEASKAQKVADLEGTRITFVNPSSNSGFKAPVVILKQQFGLEIDSDYEYGFSTSHDNSIRGIKRGEFTAAAVASDVLARMIAQGEIAPDDFRGGLRIGTFPACGTGACAQPCPGIGTANRDAILSFELADSELNQVLSSEQDATFADVTYKNDWSLIRYIDDAQGTRHAVKMAAFTPPEAARGDGDPPKSATDAGDQQKSELEG